MVYKCFVGYRFNNHEEAVIPAFYLFYISHFKEKFFKNDKKVKNARLINSLKPVLSIYVNSTEVAIQRCS